MCSSFFKILYDFLKSNINDKIGDILIWFLIYVTVDIFTFYSEVQKTNKYKQWPDYFSISFIYN